MVEEEDYQKQVEQYEKELAIWNNAVETAGHEYSVTDATWAQDNTTVTFSKLTCDHCKARKANLDCLLNDSTIETTLSAGITAETSVIGYTGDCTEGAVATYAASGKLEQGGTYYISKDVKLDAGSYVELNRVTIQDAQQNGFQLDGGRIVGLLITTAVEAVTHKKIDPKYEGYIHAAGMILLLGLMAIIMFKDIFVIVKG